MKDILLIILSISVLLGVPSTTFLMGMNLGRISVYHLTKNLVMIIKYSVAMYIIMPIVALFMLFLLPGYQEIWSGLYLVSIAPAMPLILKATLRNKHESGFALMWFVIAIILSVFFIPINLGIAEVLLKLDFKLGFLKVLWKLLSLFLLPLATGYFLKHHFPDISERIKKPVNFINKTGLTALTVSFFAISIPVFLKSDPILILLVVCFLFVALIIGIIFGMNDKVNSPLLEASLLLRFPAPAIVFMQINNSVEKHAPVIVIYTLMGLILMNLSMKFYFNKRPAADVSQLA